MGFLISFVKNDEIRPLITCQIILEMTRGSKTTQFLKETTYDLFYRILETEMRELAKH